MRDRPRRSIAVGGRGRLGDGPIADDRGVSNVVGYVLVFSLVTLTIGTVFAVGIAGVEQRQEAEQVANVERAFDVFDDNLRDVQRYDDPSRSTEIRLSGGTLSTAESTRISLVNESGDPLPVGPWEMNPVTYSTGDTTIAYEAGAWFRTDGDATVMRSAPRFVAEDGRTTLPIVVLTADGDRRVAGDATVQINADRLRSVTRPELDVGESENVSIRVESPRAAAWQRYFERTDGFVDETSASEEGVAVARLEHVDTVYVHVVSIRVTLRR
ncbi:DUF7289 family protein [Halorubrum sp. DTA46]|uniref:DUF7289 family protein n=1 Tax=Halorubrum sp. DTA46 TaxID=3402162 RepID=UPI003AAAE7C6